MLIIISNHINHIFSSDNKQQTIFIYNSKGVTRFNIKLAAIDRFEHRNITGISKIKILQHFTNRYLYVISEKSVLQIDKSNFKLINSFKPYPCHSSVSCANNITYLSRIKYRDYSLMFFCYFVKSVSVISSLSSHCLFIDSKNNVPIPIKWAQENFISTIQPVNPASNLVIQSDKFIFSGYTSISSASTLSSSSSSYSSSNNNKKIKKLAIFRNNIPNYNGISYSNNVLRTPFAPYYFEDNAEFVGAFSTSNTVYYLINEPVLWNSASIEPSCYREVPSSSSSSSQIKETVILARLIRICTHDPGGSVEFNPFNFATFAKTDIVCPLKSTVAATGDNSSPQTLTRALSMHYSNNKLFVLFANQKNGPMYNAVCSYPIETIEEVFDGPVISPWTEISCMQKDNLKIKSNPLPSVCKNLADKSLTAKQKIIASQLSIEALYRFKKVYPTNYYQGPLIELGINSLSNRKNWFGLKTIKLLDSIEIILIYSSDKLVIYSSGVAQNKHQILLSISKNHVGLLCHENTYYSDEVIVDVEYEVTENNVWIFIATSKGIIEKLEILRSSCVKYTANKTTCLINGAQFCGWTSTTKDGSVGYCEPWTRKILKDNLIWQRSTGCFSLQHKQVNENSFGELCDINDNGIKLKCQCSNVCEKSKCNLDISNCEGSVAVNENNHNKKWSNCTLEYVKKRIRSCDKSINCIGKEIDLEVCSNPKVKVYKSPWTDWIPHHTDLNKYEKYRAICQLNRTTVTSHIDKVSQKRNTYKTNDEDMWSSWSPCIDSKIRFRVQNCPSFQSCPNKNINIIRCGDHSHIIRKSTVNKVQQYPYTMLHLIVAVLLTSILWFIIVMIITLYCFHFRKSRNLTREIPEQNIPMITSPNNPSTSAYHVHSPSLQFTTST